MTKPPINLQDLRRRIYRKAKLDKSHRFWGLFVHITKFETLEEAYCVARRNGGAPGIDGAGNVQATPSMPNLALAATFAQPAALQLAALGQSAGAVLLGLLADEQRRDPGDLG